MLPWTRLTRTRLRRLRPYRASGALFHTRILTIVAARKSQADFTVVALFILAADPVAATRPHAYPVAAGRLDAPAIFQTVAARIALKLTASRDQKVARDP